DVGSHYLPALHAQPPDASRRSALGSPRVFARRGGRIRAQSRLDARGGAYAFRRADDACGWTMNADVMVVGAGPAGSSIALRLARAGVDVALLERSRFPRTKVCGEYLSPGALLA